MRCVAMRNQARLSALACAFALLSLPASADAQRRGATEAQPVTFGETYAGNITEEDAMVAGRNTRGDRYVFEGTAGTSVDLHMTSDVIDTYLVLETAEGVVIAEDDDSGGDRNARLRATLPEDGSYRVWATTFSYATGSYLVSFEERAVVPVTVVELPLGQRVRGSLDEEDGTRAEGQRVDAFEFEGTAGQTVDVLMTSNTIDTYLTLAAPTGETVATDDDGGGGTNSRLRVTLPMTGTYRLLASSFQTQLGPYEISVNVSEPTTTTPTAIVPGEMISGALAPGDAHGNGSAYGDHYTFEATSGQILTARMTSDSIDTYLSLHGPSGQLIAQNDDAEGAGTNSRLLAFLDEEGTYTLVASSFTPETGPYVLSMTLSTPAEVSPSPLRRGDRVSANLTESDPLVLHGDGRVDTYHYDGEAGERLRLRVEAHYPVRVGVVSPTGEILDEPEGISAITQRYVTLPYTGRYLISVSSTQGGTGPYVVSATPAAAEDLSAATIALGTTESGQFGPTSQMHPSRNTYMEIYEFNVESPTAIEVSMSSDTIDPYLELTDAQGAVLASNDDAFGLNSRLLYHLPSAGRYRVVATEYSMAEGPFSLTVREVQDHPVQVAEARIGDRIEASLEPTDALSISKGTPADVYLVELEAGQAITVTMTSADIDAYLLAFDPAGELVAEDDDSAGSLDARMTLRATTPGEYRIVATAYNEAYGVYRLELSAGAVDAVVSPAY